MADNHEKIEVSSVEEPIDLSAETIGAIVDADPKSPLHRRASDAIIAKAAAEHVTVSTIEHVTSPHAQSEEALTSESQRTVNLIWESTQRAVALSTVWTALFVGGYLAIRGGTDAQVAASVFLFGVANLVIGFYFGRTNHQKIGGVQQGR